MDSVGAWYWSFYNSFHNSGMRPRAIHALNQHMLDLPDRQDRTVRHDDIVEFSRQFKVPYDVARARIESVARMFDELWVAGRRSLGFDTKVVRIRRAA